jgi:hypothetical protein
MGHLYLKDKTVATGIWGAEETGKPFQIGQSMLDLRETPLAQLREVGVRI